MSKHIFVAGATGFVGRQLGDALVADGDRVIGLTRKEPRAENESSVEWRRGDLDDLASLTKAMAGCEVAYFLVHALGTGRAYPETEARWAEHFVRAGREAGISRIIYLGAPDTGGARSRHLASRLRVGEILRGSSIPTIELRASMVVGRGSASWALVREIASRVDVAVLPSWMESRTQPVALCDVIHALRHAASLGARSSEWWELPGPDLLSAREILEITSEMLKGRPMLTAYFPDLLPEVTTRWLQLLLSENGESARELALGLTDDIIMTERPFWSEIGFTRQTAFRTAAAASLEDDQSAQPASIGRFIQRVLA